MNTITVSANQKTSSAKSSVNVSLMPDARTPFRFLTSITGLLPDGKHLIRPLDVVVEYDGGEFLVSEPQFHIHTAGTTLKEALEEFKYVLADELDELTTDEEELGPRLQAELQYLRDLIRMA